MDRKYMIVFCLVLLCAVPCFSRCDNIQVPTQCDCHIQQESLTPQLVCTGLSQVPHITGTYNGLIYELNLNDNNIQNLPNGSFTGLRIQRLHILRNPLKNISETAFTGLENDLIELRLSGDSTSNINPPFEAVRSLSNLKLLHYKTFRVPNDELADIGTFSFSLLEELQLEDMKLTYILDEAFVLPNLKTMRLIKNSFTTLPILHHTLINIEHLAVTDSPITYIPHQYFARNTKVKFFDVSRNKITELESDCFQGVTNVLQTLVLNQNQLSNVSQLAEIQKLSALRELRLEYLGIKVMPDNPSFLQNKNNLQSLHLTGNSLKSFTQPLFSTSSNLTRLDLSHNQLESLVDNFFTPLHNLEHLSIQSQQSPTNLVLPSFSTLTNLETLNLEVTKLDEPSTWTQIQYLTSLISLNLDSTGLTSIKDFVFKDMNKLEQLSLHDNNISNLSQKSFFGLKDSLKFLYLSKNQLRELNECVFHDFINQLSVSLTDNSLHCDCKLAWLKRKLNETKMRFVTDQEKCSSPPKNANKLFISVSIDDFTCDFHEEDPVCENYYSTTTLIPETSATTNSVTDFPTIIITMEIRTVEYTSIDIEFTVAPLDRIDEISVEHTNLKTGEKRSQPLRKTETSHRIFGLTANINYEVCVKAKKTNNQFSTECKRVKTASDPKATTEPITDMPQNDTGIIIGASVSGVILLILLAVIMYLVIFKRKSKTKNIDNSPIKPVRAHLPTVGYDSKRFMKKKRPVTVNNNVNAENTANENIQVSVISNGQNAAPNLGRISAGSYQTLDADATVKTTPSSGDYVNSNDTRPLPATPKTHSYQNEAFQRSPTTDVDPHTYYDIKFENLV